MRLQAFFALGVSAALVFVPVTNAAPEIVGKMAAKGAVEVNGERATASATVFSGDRIGTAENSGVSVTLKAGSRLLIAEKSSVHMDRRSGQVTASVERGGLAVLGRPGESIVVHANGVRVETPDSPNAIYEVTVKDNALRVWARRGTALVTSADRTVEVKEGMMLDATVTPPSSAPANVSGLTTFQTFALVVGIAAGVAGLALGVAALTRTQPEDCRAVSPSFALACD